MTKAIVEKNGVKYFNPACVVRGADECEIGGIVVYLNDTSFGFNGNTNGANALRDALRMELSRAAGADLPDLPKEPEPWRWFRYSNHATWRANSTGCWYFKDGKWLSAGSVNTPERMRELGHIEITADEAANRIGRAVCGLEETR